MKSITSFTIALLVVAGGAVGGAEEVGSAGKENSDVIIYHFQATTAKIDQAFISKTSSAAMLEIQASHLATTQHNIPDNVNGVAHAIIDDRTKLIGHLLHIATAKKFDIPSNLSNSDLIKFNKLNGANGKGVDFLRAYDSFLVKTQKNMIALFEKEYNDTKDLDLKTFVIDTLPVLRQNVDLINTNGVHFTRPRLTERPKGILHSRGECLFGRAE